MRNESEKWDVSRRKRRKGQVKRMEKNGKKLNRGREGEGNGNESINK